MMKMVIQLDEEKILKEGIYNIADMWKEIDGHFEEQKCVKEVQSDDSVVYRCNPRKKDDFSVFGLVVFALNRVNWFVENCKTWKLCEEFENTKYSISVDCLTRQMRR